MKSPKPQKTQQVLRNTLHSSHTRAQFTGFVRASSPSNFCKHSSASKQMVFFVSCRHHQNKLKKFHLSQQNTVFFSSCFKPKAIFLSCALEVCFNLLWLPFLFFPHYVVWGGEELYEVCPTVHSRKFFSLEFDKSFALLNFAAFFGVSVIMNTVGVCSECKALKKHHSQRCDNLKKSCCWMKCRSSFCNDRTVDEMVANLF